MTRENVERQRNVVALTEQGGYYNYVSAQAFDVSGFYAALDSVRRSRGLTWRQVAKQAQVSASSLTRMTRGSRPDIDTVASLASWASVDPSVFFPRETDLSPLAMVSAYIYRDHSLTPEAASALDQVVRATYSQLQMPDTGKKRQT